MPAHSNSSLGSLVMQERSSTGGRGHEDIKRSASNRTAYSGLEPIALSPVRLGQNKEQQFRKEISNSKQKGETDFIRLPKLITRSDKAWVADNASQDCLVCGNAFSLLRRRHHCRGCGLLCCGKCTQERHVILPVASPRSSTGVPETTSLEKGLYKEASDDDGNPDGRRRADADYCAESCENPPSRRHSQSSAQGLTQKPTSEGNTDEKKDQEPTSAEVKDRCRSAGSEQSRACSNDGSSPSSYEESSTVTVDGRTSQGGKSALATRVRVCRICIDTFKHNQQEAEHVFDGQVGFQPGPFPAVKRVQTSEDFTRFSREHKSMPFTPPEGAHQMHDQDDVRDLQVYTDGLAAEDRHGFYQSHSRTVSMGSRKPRTPNRKIPTSFQRTGSSKALNRRSKKVADVTEPDGDLRRMLGGEDMDVFEFEHQRTTHRSLLKASQAHTWGPSNAGTSRSEENKVAECANCEREFVNGAIGSHGGEFCTPECFVSKALVTGRYGLLP